MPSVGSRGWGVKRRNLMTVPAGAVAYPLFAGAQQKAMPVIGILVSGSTLPSTNPPCLPAAVQQGLNETGYVEGQNVAIEYRWDEGRYDRLPALAADLVGRKVDVIVALGINAALAAKSATSTIPIVFVAGEPVAFGLVASFARPGGNVSGFSIMTPEMISKRLELLSELVPQAGMIAVLVNPTFLYTEGMIKDVQEGARAKGVQLLIVQASTESEIEGGQRKDPDPRRV